MNILIDIGHPAHVHLFKNFAWEMIKKGHEILFTARDKEFEIYLLDKYGFNYKTFGKHYSTKSGKIWGLIKFNFLLLLTSLKFKPDLFLSHGSIYAAHVCFILRKPHISLEDSGNMEQVKIYRPFTNIILSPDVLPVELGPKQFKYNSYHELAYLLHRYYEPDKKIFNTLGISYGEKYCVMRFVSWQATHDIGQKGFSHQEKKRLIQELSKHLRVFISSEGHVDNEYEKFLIKIPPEKIHDALAYATLYIGEGATMACEAGILGTPSIYVNSIVTHNNEDLGKYGLSFCFRNGIGVLEKALELLKIQNIKEEWQNRRKRMLKDKINTTEFLVWFVEKYPESVEVMKNNPENQERFRCWTSAENALNNKLKYFEYRETEKPDQDYRVGDFKPKFSSTHEKFDRHAKIDDKKMNVLVDIGHPAHVHLYRNFIAEMKKRNHKVSVTVKNIPAAKELLEKYNFEYFDIGSKSDSIKGKLLNQLHYNKLLYNIVRREKIEIGVGSSVTIAHVSKISSMKSFIFDDDDSAVEPLFAKFVHPFADFLISPDVLKFERRKKNHIVYAGYHELAYLHPMRFKPDPKVLRNLKIKPGDTFFILRFNAFKAYHDRGVQGLSLENKRILINKLKKKGKIFVTTEREIDDEFKQYQLKASPEKIHSLLYYATMFIGDSQTMTSEAAVLGTPSLRSNSFVGRISYLEQEEQKYGLTYGFKPDQFKEMLLKIDELLSLPNLKAVWARKREKMLEDKISVTDFMVWIVENCPESIKIMNENPEYQLRFK